VLDLDMTKTAKSAQKQRVFKTKWFAREAKKASINDAELCKAIQEVMEGKADNLGGGVWKKRLNKNMHRSIVFGKGVRYWFYVYLFAKKDRENIEDDELEDFRKLADGYAVITEEQLEEAITLKEFVEICL